MNAFQEAYNGLNEQQKIAVDTIEGPVMVVAGPGTGKTQILGTRIGNILQKQGDIRPNNILCLTFTEAGTVAMRKRLVKFIGPEAFKVHIHTFHGFCNMILKRHPEILPSEQMELISDLEKRRITKEILNNLDPTHPFFKAKGSQTFQARRLEGLFSDLASEDISYTYLKQKVTEYLEDIPNRIDFQYKRKTGNFQKGDPHPKKIQEAKEKMQNLLLAAELKSKYEELKVKYQRYDFNDMIALVIQAFRNDPDLLADYQEQFQYILVDEFQDTNGAQNAILELLWSYWGVKSNIFVVGDDDQAIYSFQGALVKNIFDFYTYFKSSSKVIVLDTNYRSIPSILKASEALIEHNQERLIHSMSHLNLTKQLKAGNSIYQGNHQPTYLSSFDNKREELLAIAADIQKQQIAGKKWSDFAIICPKHANLADFAQIFRVKNIPYVLNRKQNIFELTFCKRLLRLFEWCMVEEEDPYSDYHQFLDALAIPELRVTRIELARAYKEFEKRYSSEILKKSFKEAIEDSEITVSDRFIELLQIINDLINQLAALNPQEWFAYAIEQLGITEYIQNQEEGVEELQILNTLFEHVKTFCSSHPNDTIKEWMDDIAEMQEEEISLPIEMIRMHKDGVNLVTAHKSKGLEYPVVYIPFATEKNWKANNRKDFSWPDTFQLKKDEADAIEERRRLFYVAMTRAQEQLNISYFMFNEEGKDQDAVQFVYELQETIQKKDNPEVSSEEIEDFVLNQFSPSQTDSLSIPREEWIEKSIEEFILSPTALASYLRCPHSFLFNNVFRMPSAYSASLIMGQIVHYGLEQISRKGIENEQDQLEIAVEAMQGRFSHYEGWLPLDQRKRFQQAIPHITKNYLINGNFTGFEDQIPELSIKGMIEGEVSIKGQLDLVAKRGGVPVILDFKTGKHRSEDFAKPGKRKGLEHGGKYWQQATIYSILSGLSPDFKAECSQVEFHYVEEKDDHVVKALEISDEDRTYIRDLIREVDSKIRALEFPKCDDEDCSCKL